MNVSWLDDYTMIMLDTIDSTSLEAKRIIQDELQGKYIIVAEEQTVGRGKNRSFWYSPRGNLYFSILFSHDKELQRLPQLSLVSALVCHKTIDELAPGKVQVKWPNDVLLDGKKLSGILVESFPHFCKKTNQQVNYVIVGIGLNIEKSPKYLSYLATSLKEEGIEYVSRNSVLNKFMQHFQAYYDLWSKHGFKIFREQWMQNAYNLRRKIYSDVGGCKVSGYLKEIDDEGRLVVELETGEVHVMSSAEVFFQ